MPSDEAAVPGDGGTAGKVGSLPFDTSVAHQARMYDYVLGGKDNYAADRAAVEAGLKAWPDMGFYSPRSRAEVTRFFAGTDLVPPGLVALEEWRPEPGTAEAGQSAIYGAVGRKR
jgi:S-adenosyl methyltransferase